MLRASLEGATFGIRRRSIYHHIIFGKPGGGNPLASRHTLTAQSVTAANAVLNAGGEPTEQLPLIGGCAATFDEADASAAVAALLAQGYRVEVDAPVQIHADPNDHFYPSIAPSMTLIGAPSAWNTTTGSDEVVVVLDTGIDYAHPDLAANMWTNSGEVAANGIDDDSNGLVDDVYGANFIANSGDPFDDHYHGTHVAGTIGAVGNNGIGVTGVNWRTRLMALKVLSSSGSGYTSSIIVGVGYAVQMKQRGVNIRVLNASLGGGGYSAAFQQAISTAHAAGILFVASAGNSAQNNESTPSYPANYTSVISVAAVDNNGALASFSNYGATAVHIAAPGVSVLSTIPTRYFAEPNNAVYQLSGTSMAAPHVAGCAALLFSYSSALTPSSVRSTLLGTASSYGNLTGVVSSGIVNVGAALSSLEVRYELRGQVLRNGAPVAGAEVTNAGYGSTLTDSEGNFSFGQILHTSSYSLSVADGNFLASNQSGTVLGDTFVLFEENTPVADEPPAEAMRKRR